MTFLKTLARAAGLGLCVAALSGSALADPGNGNGNGPATTPPGQEKKAETPAPAPAVAPAPAPAPAPQAAHGQEQKAENQAEQAAKKAAPEPAAKSTASKSTAAKAAAPGQAKKAEKQAERSQRKADLSASKAAKAGTPSTSRSQSANAHHHVIICHRTGSDSNPYVVINIPYTAWMHAHSHTTGSHPDKNGREDKLLKDPASGPGSKDGFTKANCGAAVAPLTPSVTPTSTQETSSCPTTVTTTERVLVGIKHYTGAVENGQRKFVVISPSEKSAHMKGKHGDGEAVFETRTVTRTTSGENCATVNVTSSSNTTSTQSTQTSLTTQSTQSTAASGQAPAGGVAGAVSPAGAGQQAKGQQAKQDKPAGGVLGAVASAPEAVAETATSDTLPFTGIPLWIAALIGGALLATGLVLRRAS